MSGSATRVEQRRRRRRRLLAVRPADVPGLWWAARALRVARRDLGTVGTKLVLRGPGIGARGLSLPVLEAFLRWRRATCLERTLVVQRLLAARGVSCDVVIGVRSGDETGAVTAHAWIEGWDADSAGAGYREITRVAA